jgi:GDPmannose 4,6-dehydratase
MTRRAIVTGISGQDGHFMARLLADRGFEIVGLTSRPDAVARVETELAGLPVDVAAFDFAAPGAIAPLIARVRPSLIFNFAARATGQGMFDDPVAMTRINGVFPTEILEAIRQTDPAIGFCQASSA